ncbi:hypothetical protein DPMN_167690 [Dreissena polymorpha]|uniref:Uncharacterized protein n=1 Tax=Dreissena polymorpha TaxID=45954 RepID=A0A9D4F1C1_DREPO|nr:hypothetical protein DPMN_167690 [Dreissena polymorpha]
MEPTMYCLQPISSQYSHYFDMSPANSILRQQVSSREPTKYFFQPIISQYSYYFDIIPANSETSGY